MRNTWATTILSLSIWTVGCGKSPPLPPKQYLASRIGKPCLVQFRRGDGLGAMRDMPIGPDTTGINDSSVSLRGTFEETSDHWITLKNDKGIYCIPHSSILLIVFEP